MLDIDICNLALGKIGAAKISSMADKSDINLTNLYEQIRDEILQLNYWPFSTKRTRLSTAGILDCSSRTIGFNNINPDTITDSSSGFITAGFEAGDKVEIVGSNSNNTTYNIKSVTAGTITLEDYEEVVSETVISSADLKLYIKPAHIYGYKYLKPADCIDVVSINEITINNQPKWYIEGDYIVSDEIDSNDQITIQYIKQVTDVNKFSKLFVSCFVVRLAAEFAISIANDNVLRDYLLKEFNRLLLDSLSVTISRGNPSEEYGDFSWVKR